MVASTARRLSIVTAPEENLVGKQARIALLLGAASCLLAVMVDWIITEL